MHTNSPVDRPISQQRELKQGQVQQQHRLAHSSPQHHRPSTGPRTLRSFPSSSPATSIAATPERLPRGPSTSSSYPEYRGGFSPRRPLGGGYGGGAGGPYPGFSGSAGMGAMMGMSSMMGMYGLGSMGGPLSWLYSLNYFISSLGIMYEWLGMNSHAIIQLYHSTIQSVRRVIMIVRQSGFRRWLQQKSRQSVVLRFLFIAVTMGIASQVMNLVRLIWNEYKSHGARRLIENSHAVAESLGQATSSNARRFFKPSD